MVLRAALVVLLAGLVAATVSAAAPPRVDDCVPAKERASAVRFRAPDGTRLVGVLLGGGRTGIALGHESNANLCTWLSFARTLAANGYRVLAFDHRGHGESELDPKAFYRLDRDFLGAVAQLRARGSTRFILMGASMGGTTALAASPQVGRSLRAVVDLSAPTAYGTLNALPAVRRLAPPGLFAVGSLDAAFVDDTRELAAASTHPGSRLVIRPTSAHGTALLRSPSFRKLVLDFARSAAA